MTFAKEFVLGLPARLSTGSDRLSQLLQNCLQIHVSIASPQGASTMGIDFFFSPTELNAYLVLCPWHLLFPKLETPIH